MPFDDYARLKAAAVPEHYHARLLDGLHGWPVGRADGRARPCSWCPAPPPLSVMVLPRLDRGIDRIIWSGTEASTDSPVFSGDSFFSPANHARTA